MAFRESERALLVRRIVPRRARTGTEAGPYRFRGASVAFRESERALLVRRIVPRRSRIGTEAGPYRFRGALPNLSEAGGRRAAAAGSLFGIEGFQQGS